MPCIVPPLQRHADRRLRWCPPTSYRGACQESCWRQIDAGEGAVINAVRQSTCSMAEPPHSNLAIPLHTRLRPRLHNETNSNYVVLVNIQVFWAIAHKRPAFTRP